MTVLVVELLTYSENLEIELVLHISIPEAIYIYNVRHITGLLFFILESEIEVDS